MHCGGGNGGEGKGGGLGEGSAGDGEGTALSVGAEGRSANTTPGHGTPEWEADVDIMWQGAAASQTHHQRQLH